MGVWIPVSAFAISPLKYPEQIWSQTAVIDSRPIEWRQKCAVKLCCISECPGRGKTWGSLKLKRQIVEAFTLFTYRISDPRFISRNGSYFEGLSFIFQSLSPFLWVLLEPTLSYTEKRIDSLRSSSFIWLFVLITANSFSTKSFHGDIVQMPQSLDRGQCVSALNTLASVNLISPLQRGTGADWDS